MHLLKRSSPCFSKAFCPRDGFSKTAGCAEGRFLLFGQVFLIDFGTEDL